MELRKPRYRMTRMALVLLAMQAAGWTSAQQPPTAGQTAVPT